MFTEGLRFSIDRGAVGSFRCSLHPETNLVRERLNVPAD